MIEDLDDERRRDPGFVLPERELLEEWLEFHRTTLLLKCEGLDDLSRKARPVAGSKLSLHGLVRHMAEVEQNWFSRVLAGDSDVRYIYGDSEDADLVPLDDASWNEDLKIWQAECAASSETAAKRGLDDTGLRRGEPCSLRWIFMHMIEEYARHNGHADLIREMVDGQVGC